KLYAANATTHVTRDRSDSAIALRGIHADFTSHRNTPSNALARDYDWWQMSWLAGRRCRPPSQERLRVPSGLIGRQLSAYSCGGSRGIGRASNARTAFPFDVPCGNHHLYAFTS